MQEGKALNRVIRYTERGIEYEADQRHAEIIVDQLQVKDKMPYKVPYEKPTKEEGATGATGATATKEEEELGAEAATLYRGIAARANYLAIDRPDIQYAVKEVCRGMA